MTDRQLDAGLSTSASPEARPSAAARLGARLRAHRIAAGLTQSDVGGARFSKEYISQIERAKTSPTGEAVEWLAARLGIDVAILRSGIATDLRSRVEALLASAEALSAARRYLEAADLFAATRLEVGATGSVELELCALSGEAWARIQDGDERAAVRLLQSAREVAEGPQFSDAESADVLFMLGVCRYKLSSITTAAAIFDQALALAEASGGPCDRLRADILAWRSRCRRRQREFDAARDDVEAALELGRPADDRRAAADTAFEASVAAQQLGQWSAARTHARRAKTLYQELADERDAGRLLLNLGGIEVLRGKPQRAIEHLEASLAAAVKAGLQPEAAQALGSLATVHLHLAEYEAADEDARRALDLLAGREDAPNERGQVHLVLGRALLERGRLDDAEASFEAAGAAFEQTASAGHRAEAWVALGDLASRRGDDREAARLYRNAAEALQDIRF